MFFLSFQLKAQNCTELQAEKDFDWKGKIFSIKSKNVSLQFMGFFENDTIEIYYNNELVFKKNMVSGNDKSSTDGLFINFNNSGIVKIVLPQKNECYLIQLGRKYSFYRLQYGYSKESKSKMSFYLYYSNNLLQLE